MTLALAAICLGVVLLWSAVLVSWLRGWSCVSCGHRNYRAEGECWLCGVANPATPKPGPDR